MDRFFEPEQFSITDANNSMQLIDLGLGRLARRICLPRICKYRSGTDSDGSVFCSPNLPAHRSFSSRQSKPQTYMLLN